MARVVIEFEDKGSTVKVTATPSAEDLFKKVAAYGQGSLTAAEAYAMYAIRMLREKGKENSSRIIVPVPPIGRR